MDTYENEILDTKDAAKFLRLSTKTLENWRCRGFGPRFLKLSRKAVRYRVVDLVSWMDGVTISSTSEKPTNPSDGAKLKVRR